jgi:anti-sigma B factor antagonist
VSSFYIGDDMTLGDAGCDADVVFLLAGGELDYSASPQLRERIAEHLDAGRRQLVVDLSPTTFIDSTAIGVLVGAATRLRGSGGGSLAIICPDENRSVMRTFEIAGVSEMFGLHHSRAEALAAFGWVG